MVGPGPAPSDPGAGLRVGVEMVWEVDCAVEGGGWLEGAGSGEEEEEGEEGPWESRHQGLPESEEEARTESGSQGLVSPSCHNLVVND